MLKFDGAWRFDPPGEIVDGVGLPLTKIHHAAFDANLIGIDPDFRIHVSDRLLEIYDGPFLELGLKGIVGQGIESPIATGWRSGSSNSRVLHDGLDADKGDSFPKNVKQIFGSLRAQRAEVGREARLRQRLSSPR